MMLKLGDFGLASVLKNDKEKRYTICGTPNYIAPEILINKGHSFKVDIWSYGIILYTLLTGNPPFEKNNVKETYEKIKFGKFDFPKEFNYSNNVIDLIKKLLIK